jgi:hypothetical protein
MIGIWHLYVNIFLYVAGIAMLVFFGLPLLLVPLRWARLFRWEIPASTDLAVGLGRSLGAILSVVAVFAFLVIKIPEAMPFFFDFLLCSYVLLIAVHLYGALKKIQPITETLEIILWILLFLVTLCFYPA